MGTNTLQNLTRTGFDADGFLREPGAWSEDLARHIAVLDGLGDLDERQMKVLRQLRASFQRQGAVPAMAHICHLDALDADCMSRMFNAPREAWRIAGLPNPGEEAKAYMD